MIPKIEKILYATGLGPGAPYVFRYALSLAQAYQAKIFVVNAMEPLSTFGQSLVELHISHNQSEQIHQEARQKVKNNILARVKKLCAKESSSILDGSSLVTDIEVVEGQAAQVILAKAEEIAADVIVMGTQSHSIIGEAMLGSTARKVLHRGTIPTFLVRIPEGYSEEGF
ncbi:MAG: universal stress protein [Desulfobulbaceae bacterium]|nr:universal stress protein [Desulfobulbaceae bacterium]